MPFSVLVVTQAMVLLAFLMLAFLAVNHSKVKLTHDPFATNQLDFLQVTQSNQQVTTPRHLTARTALLPMSHATCNAYAMHTHARGAPHSPGQLTASLSSAVHIRRCAPQAEAPAERAA